MRLSARSSIVRFVLLCLLGFAVVGMHHVVATSLESSDAAMPAVSSSEPVAAAVPTVSADAPAPDHSGHASLHMCLAILAATGSLLLLAGRMPRSPFRAVAAAASRLYYRLFGQVDGSPPRSGRTLLANFCVLRI